MAPWSKARAKAQVTHVPFATKGVARTGNQRGSRPGRGTDPATPGRQSATTARSTSTFAAFLAGVIAASTPAAAAPTA